MQHRDYRKTRQGVKQGPTGLAHADRMVVGQVPVR